LKLLHLSDLHIGKRVNEFSMIEDQKYILNQIILIITNENPDAVLIAGDIYDKNIPPAEAVEVLDNFLTQLMTLQKPVFLISGNHDSPQRLSFGRTMFGKNKLFIESKFNGNLFKETLYDEEGAVNFYLLPFIKPAHVKAYYDEEIVSYESAVLAVIAHANINKDERNVLIAHQFITNSGADPKRSDSENISVGGMDNIDASVFDAFDIVALGHIHGPQKMLRETIRYCGSPLKYSFSESRHRKSVILWELGEKGTVDYQLIPLVPLRDMREIKGPINELIRVGKEQKLMGDGSISCDDYIRATLTDEGDIYDAIGQMREIYPNIMQIDFENSKSKINKHLTLSLQEDIANKEPIMLFSEFYESQNNIPLDEEKRLILKAVFEYAEENN